MKKNALSVRRRLFLLSIFLAFIMIACNLSAVHLPGNGPAVSTPSTNSTPNPSTQQVSPSGWVLSKDPTGACQVATPPGWKLGSDFFFEAGKINSGPFRGTPGVFPPVGPILWATPEAGQTPQGRQFQVRKSLVTGTIVCSVWRIKANTDFTDVEKSEMDQVGQTLQEVH